MNIAAYLQRLNYSGSTAPTLETLRALHRAHLFTVPFENFDIHLSRPIILDEEKLFQKIVRERRGGFCYELNGLFAALLRSLGFQINYYSGRVINRAGEVGPEFDHLALRVDLDEPYLVDVGFGDGFLEPLRLNSTQEQIQGEMVYRLEASEGDSLTLRQRKAGGEWENCFRFTLQPYNFSDFAPMCHYHQTSPDSPFTRRRVAIRLTPEGQLRLVDMKLTKIAGNETQEQLLESSEEYHNTLRELFGLNLEQFNLAAKA